MFRLTYFQDLINTCIVMNKASLIPLFAMLSPAFSATNFYTDYSAWEAAGTATGGVVIYEDFNGQTGGTAFSSPLSSTAGSSATTATLGLTTSISSSATTGPSFQTGTDWNVERGDGSRSGVRIQQDNTGPKVVAIDLASPVSAVSFFGMDMFDTSPFRNGGAGTPYEYSFTVEIDFGSGFTEVYDSDTTVELGGDGNGSVNFTLFNSTTLAGGGTTGSQTYGDDSNNLGNNGGLTFDGTHFGFISDSVDIEQVRFSHNIEVQGTDGSGENIGFDHFSFIVPEPIPEPSSALLLGLSGLLFWNRKRSK